MLDVEGVTLSSDEKTWLAHPNVGGVILFSRNFVDGEQLRALVHEIRQCKPHMLIAVDHEGGRVQRFKHGFTWLPAMGDIIKKAKDLTQARVHASQLGWLMAYELALYDIDMSFAPVLDLNGVSQVIGDRSFSAQVSEVVVLASEFIDGMHEAGMKCTGKHFPGHGSVIEDSHVALPIDDRAFEQIDELDLQVFRQLIAKQQLDAVMPAHVIYSQVDNQGAGFSSVWLQSILRKQLGFNGVIFSDDLSMEGAGVQGGYLARAQHALNAGCDMVLACNQPAGAREIVQGLVTECNPRLASMRRNVSVKQDEKRHEKTKRWVEEIYR